MWGQLDPTQPTSGLQRGGGGRLENKGEESSRDKKEKVGRETTEGKRKKDHRGQKGNGDGSAAKERGVRGGGVKRFG